MDLPGSFHPHQNYIRSIQLPVEIRELRRLFRKYPMTALDA
jgi:hypothetical protein